MGLNKLEFVPFEDYIYFRRPNGAVIGKRVHEQYKNKLPDEVWDRFMKLKYVPCDSSGEPLKKKTPPKKKKVSDTDGTT